MTIKAMICGAAGLSLSKDERTFFADNPPAGLILFARNCETPEQVKQFVADFRNCVDHEPLILIDQEGGRVQRLVPPHWPQYPPGEIFGKLYDANPEHGLEAAYLSANLIGHDLAELGINMDCLPVLDLSHDDGHEVIGNRAHHSDPRIVAEIGRKVSQGLLDAGVLPVIKHIPGHGRAGADSHIELPKVEAPRDVLEANDFVPFEALADMPAAMTAHVLYTNLDAMQPATVSAAIIREVIRGRIGFSGLLMSDDVSMEALEGTIGERTKALIEAGCDVALHCNGDMGEMIEVAKNVPDLANDALARFERALAMKHKPAKADRVAAMARLEELTG